MSNNLTNAFYSQTMAINILQTNNHYIFNILKGTIF